MEGISGRGDSGRGGRGGRSVRRTGEIYIKIMDGANALFVCFVYVTHFVWVALVMSMGTNFGTGDLKNSESCLVARVQLSLNSGIMALDLFSAVKGSLFHGDAINIDNLVRRIMMVIDQMVMLNFQLLMTLGRMMITSIFK